MKTVLGQLIETLENIIEDESVSPDDAAHYSVAIIHARRLLEAERKQIEAAYNQGYRDGERNGETQDQRDISEWADSKRYFTDTFNS